MDRFVGKHFYPKGSPRGGGDKDDVDDEAPTSPTPCSSSASAPPIPKRQHRLTDKDIAARLLDSDPSDPDPIT